MEITVNLTGLDSRLGANTRFTIEVTPNVGAVMAVNWITPAELTAVVDLK